MRRLLGTLLAAVVIALLAPVASPATPPCWPSGYCYSPGPVNYRAVALVQGSFAPQAVDVPYADILSFYNLDDDAHTATDVRCTDADDTTYCAFDRTLAPGDWFVGRNTVTMGGPGILPESTYGFVCTLHGETGSFTVTGPRLPWPV